MQVGRVRPFFIPAGIVGRFQTCCIHLKKSAEACGYDASEEVVAECRDGSKIHIPVCSNPEHQREAVVAKKLIEQGKDPKVLETLEWAWLFIQPPESSEKCKLPNWELYLEAPPPAILEPRKILSTKSIAAPVIVVHEAMVGWTWVDDIDKWMSITGEVVRISKLSNAEFIAAALAIRDANGITKRTAWVKDLVPPREGYRWPANALKVGTERAGNKLDDFKDSADDRGLIS